MGRPILKICAKPGCDVTDCTSDPTYTAGVDFSVQDCNEHTFFRAVDSKVDSKVTMMLLVQRNLANRACIYALPPNLWQQLCADSFSFVPYSYGRVVENTKSQRCSGSYKG